MEPNIEEARALQERVQELGNDMWSPYDSGRYAYHINIPLGDNPWDEPPNIDRQSYSDWARGWLHEHRR